MKDSIIKGTGNSRAMKSSIPAGTTWEQALAMLREGTFPLDLNGINAAGFQQVGSALSKANMMPDDTARALGLDPADDPQVKDGFEAALEIVDSKTDFIRRLKMLVVGFHTYRGSEWNFRSGGINPWPFQKFENDTYVAYVLYVSAKMGANTSSSDVYTVGVWHKQQRRFKTFNPSLGSDPYFAGQALSISYDAENDLFYAGLNNRIIAFRANSNDYYLTPVYAPTLSFNCVAVLHPSAPSSTAIRTFYVSGNYYYIYTYSAWKTSTSSSNIVLVSNYAGYTNYYINEEEHIVAYMAGASSSPTASTNILVGIYDWYTGENTQQTLLYGEHPAVQNQNVLYIAYANATMIYTYQRTTGRIGIIDIASGTSTTVTPPQVAYDASGSATYYILNPAYATNNVLSSVALYQNKIYMLGRYGFCVFNIETNTFDAAMSWTTLWARDVYPALSENVSLYSLYSVGSFVSAVKIHPSDGYAVLYVSNSFPHFIFTFDDLTVHPLPSSDTGVLDVLRTGEYTYDAMYLQPSGYEFQEFTEIEEAPS